MGRSKPLVSARILSLLAGIAAPSLALGADLLPPPPLPVPPPAAEFAGGWYLRGDVGVGVLDLRRTVAVDVSTPSLPYKYAVHQDRLGDQFLAGVGVGYQVNPWLRFDATGEYRTKTDWHFLAEDKTGGDTGGFNLTKGQFASVVGLVNGYVEFPTRIGLIPFLGAGVGFAHHMFGSVVDTGYGNYAGGIGGGGPKDRTNFAWAAHAGLGYAVTPNLRLELAYRYLNMGDAETGTVACLPGCPTKTVYKVRDIDSHDIRLGMRWLFGGPVVAAYEPPPLMPAPLVRKY